MIPSKMDGADYPSRVPVRGGRAKQIGLISDSVIMADNLQTVQHSGIDRLIGRLENLRDADSALRETLWAAIGLAGNAAMLA